MQYRRAENPGYSYFSTLITHNRCLILCVLENIELLRDLFKQVLVPHPFEIDVIMLHALALKNS
jgi:putative transposase